MKYRTKHITMIGYFVQSKSGFFSGWKTLVKKDNNIYEKNEDYTKSPLESESKAILLAHEHAEICNVKKGFTSYSLISS